VDYKIHKMARIHVW